MNLIRGCKRRPNQTLVLQESQVNKHTVAHKLLQSIAIQIKMLLHLLQDLMKPHKRIDIDKSALRYLCVFLQ